jgi:hypothetical protein
MEKKLTLQVIPFSAESVVSPRINLYLLDVDGLLLIAVDEPSVLCDAESYDDVEMPGACQECPAAAKVQSSQRAAALCACDAPKARRYGDMECQLWMRGCSMNIPSGVLVYSSEVTGMSVSTENGDRLIIDDEATTRSS